MENIYDDSLEIVGTLEKIQQLDGLFIVLTKKFLLNIVFDCKKNKRMFQYKCYKIEKCIKGDLQ